MWNDWSFYGNRMLLGLAEAGFYPGVVAVPHLVVPVLLPHPHDGHLPVGQRDLAIHRSADRRIAAEDAGVAGPARLAVVTSSKALPPVIMCFAIWRLLTDRPHDAGWLRPEQRPGCRAGLDRDSQRESVRQVRTWARRWRTRRVWLLTVAYVGQNGSSYGLVFFLPLIVKGLAYRSD